MIEPAAVEDLWIVGAGRMGLALGLVLHGAGGVHSLTFVGRDSTPPDHPLFIGDTPVARYRTLPDPLDLLPTGVVLAVPDSALTEAVADLIVAGLRPGTPVLHMSGAYGLDVLQPLAKLSCPVGSLHPLASVADPIRGAERLRGVWWGVAAEGAALGLAERIVQAAEGRILSLSPGTQPLYHAAAVFASNYVVALLSAAERLMEQAGVRTEDAREALTELATGTVRNVAAKDPVAALTGPIARGDAGTVALHLASLSDAERALYSPLARAVLELARVRGVDLAAAQRIEDLLEDKES